MGRRKGRELTGIFLLDKDKDISSNSALQQVKRLYDAKKAGHTGSLDPMATGLLPICFGKATKICQYLLDSDKTYEATIQLGVQTETGDTEGDVIERSVVPDLPAEKIEQVLSDFRGSISQVPPMYSALKKDGVPLYKLARRGIEIEREARDVVIHKLECLDYRSTLEQLDIRVTCSKGTYIRTLAEDIAKGIGCGAHLIMLRRTGCGLFSIDDAHQYFPMRDNRDKDSCIISAENTFLDKEILTLPVAAHDHLMKTGKFIYDAPKQDGLYRLYHEYDDFFGIAIFKQGKMVQKQLFI